MSGAPTKTLKDCGEAVKPTSFLEYTRFLQSCYTYLKDHVEGYSYLQFAEDLGFSKTNVIHLVIRGKRRLSLKGVEKITRVFNLRGVDRQYLECLVKHNNARKPLDRDKLFERLLEIKNKELTNPIAQDQLEYYKEWYHPVIRELVGLRVITREDPHFVDAIQPRVLPEQGRKSLELLEKIDLIRYDEEKGRYVQTAQNVSTGDEITSLAVIRYHKEVIEIARDSITTVKAKRRDISAVTVAVDDETAQKMKQEIQLFRKRLLAIADECQNPEHIYQINFQLFPFTK
jgi:uncharacterized protein (TIGR02147 family)